MNLTTDPYEEKEVPTTVPLNIRQRSQKNQNKTTAVDRYCLRTGPLQAQSIPDIILGNTHPAISRCK